MSDDSNPRKPSFIVTKEHTSKDGRTFEYRVGAAFENRDGESHTVYPNAGAIAGPFVLRTPQERLDDMREEPQPAPAPEAQVQKEPEQER